MKSNLSTFRNHIGSFNVQVRWILDGHVQVNSPENSCSLAQGTLGVFALQFLRDLHIWGEITYTLTQPLLQYMPI